MMPALRKWCPPSALKGGSFDKGWNGARNILSFACGSSLSFKTYQQDPSTLGGAELKFVGYDEPPPQGHREESRMRLMGGGFEMFAMTPAEEQHGLCPPGDLEAAREPGYHGREGLDPRQPDAWIRR
jgi:hypothetical protein